MTCYVWTTVYLLVYQCRLCVSGLVGDLPCSNVDQMARFTDLDLCGGNGADSCMFQNDL